MRFLSTHQKRKKNLNVPKRPIWRGMPHIKEIKKICGDAGDRTRGLSHAKRTLYH